MPIKLRSPLPSLALLAAVSLVGAPAAAQTVPFGGEGAEPGAPVEVTSETLSLDQAAGTAVFEGSVVIGQGALRVNAPRVEVEYTEDRRISRLTATGGVTIVNGPDAAEGAQAVYDVDAGTIVMTGDVLLTQQATAGGAALSAERMNVDLATGEAVLEGRVRTVLPQN